MPVPEACRGLRRPDDAMGAELCEPALRIHHCIKARRKARPPGCAKSRKQRKGKLLSVVVYRGQVGADDAVGLQGAERRNLGDVKWCTPRRTIKTKERGGIACFVLTNAEGKPLNKAQRRSATASRLAGSRTHTNNGEHPRVKTECDAEATTRRGFRKWQHTIPIEWWHG